jgi:hypothetical protein
MIDNKNGILPDFFTFPIHILESFWDPIMVYLMALPATQTK